MGRLFETLDGLEAEDLGKTVSIRGEPHSVPLAIHRSLSHCAYHVGQIIMVARILAGENWERITIARGQSTAYNEQVWDKGHFSMAQDETNESRENDRAAVQECEENTYRWNVTAAASGYDRAAEHVHPHYVEIQDVILDALPFDRDDAFTVVDAGGGSGRLVERILDRFLIARGLIIDQSEAFLALAERRLSRFGSRAACHHVRLQDDWPARINADIHAIVSMSAIHHLDADEKREFYGRGFRSLAGGGLLINGDEVRPPGAAAYLSELRAWAGHMRRLIADGLGSSRKKLQQLHM